MRKFVFRNNTIEFFFNQSETDFSGYGDISAIPSDVDEFIWFYQPPLCVETDNYVSEIESYKDKFDLVISQIPLHKTIFVFTLVNLFSVRIETSDFSFGQAITAFNNHVYTRAKELKNIKVVDFSSFTKKYIQSSLIDWKYYFMSQLPFGPKIVADFKSWWSSVQNTIALKRKKCIVLDLDNTLWGGVLGEDGISGIKIGGDYPGNAFLYFQKCLLALEKKGVLLAICSKNNEEDVFECWEKNPFNVITEKNLVTYRINWNNKANNIQEIADELNLGVDSFVFIDDNPSERELIRKNLPQVVVPDFPLHPHELPIFVEKLIEDYFTVYECTETDLKKTESYKVNALRKSEATKFVDLDSFIASLNICLTIDFASEVSIPRIAQMTQKTNQFNLTTRRYTESDLLHMIERGAEVLYVSVKDKFDDSGITGCCIIKNNEIDTFLLSCRVLGKGIEHIFLAQILLLLKNKGRRNLTAKYIPTVKNIQVANFYETSGFTLREKLSDGSKIYEIDLSAYSYQADSKYKVTIGGKKNER